MYCLIDFCCICFNNKDPLQHLFTADTDNITYFIKLTSIIPEMCFNEMNDRRLICKKCCENIEEVYKFRQKCLESKTMLIDYISQLHKVSNIRGNVNVYLTDINKFDIVKKGYLNNNVTKTKLFEDINEKLHSEHKSECNEINLKTDPRPNYTKFETVVIKMESENQNSEQNVDKIIDDPLGTHDEVDANRSYVELAASEIKKEVKNEDVEYYLHENFNNILETSNDENVDIERKFIETCEYSINSENYSEDSLINPDEIKIEIVHNDVELMDSEINNQCKSKDIEECSNEDIARPLKVQNVYNNDKDEIFSYKTEKEPEKNVPSTSKVQDVDSKKVETIRKKTHECSVCQKTFNRSFYLTAHMRIHTGEKPHECNICMKKFRRADTLNIHIKIHTGEKPYECNICKKKFICTSNLSRHMVVHTGEKSYECNICKNKFSHSKSLSRHMVVHTDDKPYGCKNCDKKFRQPSGLSRHMLVHSGEKPYECNVCKKKFRQSGNLSGHMLIHTEKMPYKCDICEKKFRYSRSLSTHMLIHTGEKPYECKICKKKFRKTGNLSSHMLVHTVEMSYECNICGKKFIHSKSLPRHMLIHTEEMTYECNICEKKFRYPNSLSSHMLIHTGEKPYECNICKKKFRKTSNLSGHMLIHTEEKQYECNICKKKFRKSSSLSSHMLIHTEELPYRCNICEKKFIHSSSLTRHMLVHTEEKKDLNVYL